MVEIAYTPEEKEILRRASLKTLRIYDSVIYRFDGRKEVKIAKIVILPRGFKNKKPFY